MSKNSRKLDLQTLSLFLTLAILTGMFLFGLKRVFLTPEAPPPSAIEATQAP